MTLFICIGSQNDLGSDVNTLSCIRHLLQQQLMKQLAAHVHGLVMTFNLILASSFKPPLHCLGLHFHFLSVKVCSWFPCSLKRQIQQHTDSPVKAAYKFSTLSLCNDIRSQRCITVWINHGLLQVPSVGPHKCPYAQRVQWWCAHTSNETPTNVIAYKFIWKHFCLFVQAT